MILDADRHANTNFLMGTFLTVSMFIHGVILYATYDDWKPDATVQLNSKGQSIKLSFIDTSKPAASPVPTTEAEPVKPQTKTGSLPAQASSTKTSSQDKTTIERLVISNTETHRNMKVTFAMSGEAGQHKLDSVDIDRKKSKSAFPSEQDLKSSDVENTRPKEDVADYTTNNTGHQLENVGTSSTNVNVLPNRQKILRNVNDQLKKYLQYPFLARKRGWSGKVTISFEFTARGTIHNIHLSRSSGYPLLDNSALNAFHSIMHIRFVDQTVDTQSATLQLPVEYHLTEG